MKKKNLKKKSESILLLLIILLTFASVLKIDLDNTQKNKERPEQPGLNSSNSSWAPSFSLAVGRRPWSVFIGDANNNGYKDIITSNQWDDDVSILLWNSTSGDWDTQITKPVGNTPLRVIIGDANNDGYNDIVTTNFIDDDVSILLWNSTLSDWNAQIRESIGENPSDVFVGDANNDGYNDIVTSNSNTDDISVLLWNSILGDWDTQIRKPVGDNPWSVFVEDANNDGYKDIITSNRWSDNISVLLWNSITGDWDTQIRKSVGKEPWNVFVGDANNDDYNDIVTTNSEDDDISVLLWNSTLSDWDVQIRKPVGDNPLHVFLGDANNDGYNDIVTANSEDDDISVFLWNSTLSDWNVQIRESVGDAPVGVFVGDANNDGYNDIVTANQYSYDVSIVLWNTPSIIINQPLNHDLFGNTAPDYNITVQDQDLDSMWYTLDTGITNVSIFQYNGLIDQLEWDKLENGTVIIRFFANDTFGQICSAYVIVGKNVWSPPNPPVNVKYYSGYHNIKLEWDPPEYSSPITQYNVYRGDIPGGGKNYIGNSDTTNFTDDTVDNDKFYYYIVRAENIQGESNASEEIQAIAGPYIRWQTPNVNGRVILPVGDAVFNLKYNYGSLNEIKLFLNDINYGSVKDKSSTILNPYNASIDGPVNAVLYGYELGNPNPIVNDSRNFTFGKLTWEAIEVLDEDTEFLGDQLYLILHDPNGDRSYSGFAEQTGLSFGVGSSVSISTGFSISAGFSLFGTGAGASTKLKVKYTDKYDFRFEVTEKTELTSSLDRFNKDYIGPGYGDTYWGEAWTINWQLKGMHRTYFNGTTRYEEPTMDYGLIRSGEVLLGDHHAPAEWRALNPVHNDWANVEWGEGVEDNITVTDGSSYSNTKEVSTSDTRTFEFQMNLDASLSLKFPGVTLSFTFGLEVKTYIESEVTDVYTTSYTIHDDESPDLLSMQRGVDTLFGTPIFRPYPSICKTSNPLEHNTIDYIPPVIEFPNVNFDSSLDGLAPCEDDSPIVTVDIFDEGGIPSALISFSINDGANWDSIILSEQIANPGTWEGLIPSQDHGTIVLWYIKVWDYGGSYSNRTDPHGNSYQYTVINRAPTILITTPNGNEAFDNTMRIEWSALDHDDDDLTFSIAYNLADTGWRLIETGVSGSYYDWDISGIQFCDTVLIKVTVDDGFGGTAYDESDYVFTIGEPEPVEATPSEINWTLPLTIAILSFVGAAFTIAIFIRRSRSVKEQ